MSITVIRDLFLGQRAHVEQLQATEMARTKAHSTLKVRQEVVQRLQGYWISVGAASPQEQQHTPNTLEVIATSVKHHRIFMYISSIIK